MIFSQSLAVLLAAIWECFSSLPFATNLSIQKKNSIVTEKNKRFLSKICLRWILNKTIKMIGWKKSSCHPIKSDVTVAMEPRRESVVARNAWWNEIVKIERNE